MAGLLRSTIEREGLQGRVRMLGAIPSDQVRDVLVRALRPSLLRVDLRVLDDPDPLVPAYCAASCSVHIC